MSDKALAEHHGGRYGSSITKGSTQKCGAPWICNLQSRDSSYHFLYDCVIIAHGLYFSTVRLSYRPNDWPSLVIK